MKIQYGETTRTQDLCVYIVETTFPGFHGDAPKPDKFGRFIASAYTPKDKAGRRTYFVKDERFKALFQRPERANYDSMRDHQFNESIVYLTVDAACEAAKAIRDNAVLAHPYENSAEWSLKERGLPLKVRVVEHRLARVDRVVKLEGLE